jgi:hypothetical protein
MALKNSVDDSTRVIVKDLAPKDSGKVIGGRVVGDKQEKALEIKITDVLISSY